MQPITDFEGYFVGRDGVVIGVSGQALKPQMTASGYCRVFLGYGKGKRVHRLVAAAFVENPHRHKEVNHKNGNKQNNNADNLEWVSRRENMRHAYSTGLAVNKNGEEATRAKLTQAEVDFVRSNYRLGHKESGQTALGSRFSVSNSCIWRVVHEKNWAER